MKYVLKRKHGAMPCRFLRQQLPLMRQTKMKGNFIATDQ